MKNKFKLNVSFFILILCCTIFLPNNSIKLCSADPALRIPADNSYTNDNTPKLGWYTHSGVSKYNIQLWYGNFLTKVVDAEVAHPGDDYVVLDPQSDMEYVFRVREYIIGLKQWSDWSPVWSFYIDTVSPSTPVLDSPSDDFVTTDDTPILEWNQVTEAHFDFYEVFVDDNADFSSPERLYHINDKTDTDVTVSSALPDGKYYWKVRAVDKAHNEASSSARSFTIDTTPPSQIPSLSYPSDDSYFKTTSIYFSWGYYPQDDPYNSRLLYSKDSSWTGTNYQCLTADMSCTMYGLTEGIWYWKVRAEDEAGNSGTWSTVRSFTIDFTAPFAPDLLTPESASRLNETDILFSWSEVADADEYQLQVTDDDNFGSITEQAYTSETSLAFTTGFMGSYECFFYWRVRSKDLAGNWGSWSEISHFLLDNVPPEANNPDDLVYDEGSEGNNITWIVPTAHHSDENQPLSYKVYIDSVLNVSGYLYEESDDNITIIVDGLEAGEHTVRLILTDLTGNTFQDTVLVTVQIVIREYSTIIPILSLSFLLVGLCSISKRRGKSI